MAVKTITLGEIKKRLAELEDLYLCGEPDEDQKTENWHELLALQELRHDLDWCWEDDDVCLIRSVDFTEYGMELLYESGDVRKGGICDRHLDYDKVTEDLEQDHKLVVYDDEDYWVRNV